MSGGGIVGHGDATQKRRGEGDKDAENGAPGCIHRRIKPRNFLSRQSHARDTVRGPALSRE